MGLFTRLRRRFCEAKYRDFFQLLDRDGDGLVRWADFEGRAEALTARLQIDPDDLRAVRVVAAQRAYWEVLVARTDEDGDGAIGLGELCGFLHALADNTRRAEEVPDWALEPLRALLDVIDQDGDGQIDGEEFADYLGVMRSDANPEVAFTHLDLNGDGRIDLDELQRLYAQWLTSEDPASPGNWLMTGRLSG